MEITLHDELISLRERMERAAAADTAYSAEDWDTRKGISPLTSHCGPVSYAVQRLFGGFLNRRHRAQ